MQTRGAGGLEYAMAEVELTNGVFIMKQIQLLHYPMVAGLAGRCVIIPSNTQVETNVTEVHNSGLTKPE